MNFLESIGSRPGNDKGLIALFACLLISCGLQQPATSGISGVSDSSRTALLGNIYPEGTTDVHPGIPVNQGEKLYFIDMKDANSQHKGYAIDCAGGNLASLALNAFGFDASLTIPSQLNFTQLKTAFKIDEQPIFRCSGLNPKPKTQQIRNVFQLVKDDSPESQALPDLYLRFNSYPGDDFDVGEFYSVGCRNILNAFGTPSQADLKDAIPILASTKDSLFPGLANYKPLNCMSAALPPLLDAKPKREADIALRTTTPVLDSELQFYKVTNLDQTTARYMIGSPGKFHRVNCPGVPANHITGAFNFPANYQVHEIDINDPLYLESEQNSQLHCINSQTPTKFTKKLVTVRSNPPINYYYLPDPASIFQFGCPAAAALFTEDLAKPLTEFKVTYESVRYLKSGNAVEQVADELFPCYDRVHEYRSLVTSIYQKTLKGVVDEQIIDQTVNECRYRFDNSCTQDAIEKKFMDIVLTTKPYNLQQQRWGTRQNGFWGTQQWVPGDFNGDGKVDLANVFVDSGLASIDVHLSNGSSFFATQRWATGQGWFWDAQKWMAGDFNGDGKDDLVNVFKDGDGADIDVHLSTGSSFGMERWATGQGWFWDAQQWVVGDFNGDGKDDLAKAFNEAGEADIDVHLSSGSSFWMERWATRQGGFSDTQKWMAGDFNGDGKADMAKVFGERIDGVDTASIDVHPSSGRSFGIQRWATGHGWFWNDQIWKAGDFNGDGKADVVNVFWDNGQDSIDLHLSSGSNFGMQRWTTRQWGFVNRHKLTIADFSGDGRADLASVFEDGGQASIDVFRK